MIDTLSAPDVKQRADILNGADAAADGERHEARLGGAPHHVEDDAAVFVAGCDVEKAKLVGAGRVIGDRRLHRIAGVAQIDEIDALDHAAVFDVEAGNDADLEHSGRPCRADEAERFRRIEPPVVERAAGDCAFELLRVWLKQRLDVVDGSQATRGDDRN